MQRRETENAENLSREIRRTETNLGMLRTNAQNLRREKGITERELGKLRTKTGTWRRGTGQSSEQKLDMQSVETRHSKERLPHVPTLLRVRPHVTTQVC